MGEDACALTVERGALVAATDPITFTGVDIGRLAVVVNANDVAVMGVRPRWFLAAILLPCGTTEDDVRTLFAGMRGALAELGIALVGGHTEVTPVVSQPLVVGQMLGLAENDRFVATGGARPGDIVVQVGLAPIEGAAVLAVIRWVIKRGPGVVLRPARAAAGTGLRARVDLLAAAAFAASAAVGGTVGTLFGPGKAANQFY